MNTNTPAANQKSKPTPFSPSNIILGLAVVFVLLMLFVPNFKSTVIRAIMKIGVFQPKIERSHIATPLSSGDGGDIVLFNAENDTLHLSNLKGKVVFFNMWATWCGPCKAELPSIASLKKHFSNHPEIVFITIDRDGNPGAAQAFLQKQKLSLPVWATLARKQPEFLWSKAIPFTVVLDKKGYIAFQHMGIADYDGKKFIQFIETLNKE